MGVIYVAQHVEEYFPNGERHNQFMSTPDESDYALVHTELVALVESARTVAAHRVNALMSAVYWEIGRRIVETEQGAKDRPTYGEGLIEKLAMDLGVRFGRGFSATNLRQMRAFHLAWPPKHIQQTVSADSFGRHNDPASRVSAVVRKYCDRIDFSVFLADLHSIS